VRADDVDLGMTKIRVINQNSVAGQVVRQLLNYLVSSNIGPGNKLPSERALAEHLGVGRSTVREAVKSLHLLGIVEVRQGDGTYLRGTESTILPQILEWGLVLAQPHARDLVEAREYLEIFVARRAAERMTGEGAEQLDGCIQRMADAEVSGRTQDFVEADVEFHFHIAEQAGNSVFVDLLRSIRTLLHVWITRVVESEGVGDTVQQHVRIAEAIKAGDAERAEEAMRAHMASAAERLRNSSWPPDVAAE
jgi:GntR family transcriptional regulator, transcriptional repressor for pyruvate dehydrogenase complex